MNQGEVDRALVFPSISELPLPLPKKVGAVETAAEFLKKRTENATPDDFAKSLESVPGHPPMEGDELPEGWAKTQDYKT